MRCTAAARITLDVTPSRRHRRLHGKPDVVIPSRWADGAVHPFLCCTVHTHLLSRASGPGWMDLPRFGKPATPGFA